MKDPSETTKEDKEIEERIRISKEAILMRISRIQTLSKSNPKTMPAYRRLQTDFIKYVAKYGQDDTLLIDKAKLISDAMPRP